MATLIATYTSVDEANHALQELGQHGVPRDNISIASLQQEEHIQASDSQKKGAGEIVRNAAGDTMSGAVGGAAVGGVLGLLAGIAALSIPGLGPLLITGPLAASLGLSGIAASTVTGAGAGTAVGGVAGLAGSLVGAGVSETEAQQIHDTIRRGGVMVAVAEEGSPANVREILEHANPSQLVTIQ